MSQFDVYQMSDGSLVLDLQANDLYNTNTRIVAPLFRRQDYIKPIPRANPELKMGGETYVVMAHFLTAVLISELRNPVGNLAASEYEIKSALDMLFYGF